jgi:hypothetical protein
MATAQEIVTRAFRALQAIDINEQPTPNEAQVGLDTLEAMIADWATHNLNTVDQTLGGTTAAGSPEVTQVETEALARGMNVFGTGIPDAARIKSIDHRRKTVTLTINATASGTVSLIFTLLPFEARYEQGVTALLALQLAPLLGIDNIPGMVTRNAVKGWQAIFANFYRIPLSGSDLPRQEDRLSGPARNG